MDDHEEKLEKQIRDAQRDSFPKKRNFSGITDLVRAYRPDFEYRLLSLFKQNLQTVPWPEP